MPNTPDPNDPNRPAPEGRTPEGTPTERLSESSDDARQEGTARRQTAREGGLGQDAPGGYRDQVPATRDSGPRRR